MKAIVVGAGIVGTSIAYRLAQAGVSVTVLEAGRVGGGTSGVSYAWVNACEKISRRDYFELNFAGVKAHRALGEELGENYWLHRPGVVQWENAGPEAQGLDDGEPENKLERLKAWGYPAEAISQDDLRGLEPDVNADAFGDSRITLYPEDGWADAVVYCGAMMGAAQARHGAKLICGARVVGLDMAGGRARGVKTADGAVHGADIVVNCAGRWSNDVAGDPAISVPLAPTLGIIAYTAAVGTSLRRALRTPTVHVRRDGGGRLLFRANDVDRQAESDASLVPGTWTNPAQPQAQELLRRARHLLPSLAHVELEAVRTAIRPIPRDGFPAVGPVRDMAGYYVAVTHSGVTLAPFLGRAVSDEIVNGVAEPLLAPFRPNRLMN